MTKRRKEDIKVQNDMQTTRLEIGDGINLCHIRTGKFKHASLAISYATKLTTENAVMNSLLTSVLTKSCAKFPKMEDFNRELDRLYAASINGSVRKYGEAHTAIIKADTLQNKFVPDGEDVIKELAELLLDVLLSPSLPGGVFDKEILESEKTNLIDLIRASQNDKDGYAVRRCAEIMCENEKFSTYVHGDEETVAEVTAEALTEKYHEIVSGAKFEIYFVGDYDCEALADILRERFQDIRRNVSLEFPATKVRRKTSGEVKRVNETAPISQAKLCIGFRLGRSLADRNFAAVTLLKEIYGGSPTSKLFVNVREKLSLCYYCSPALEQIKGIMIVASAIEEQNKEKAEEEILLQLDKIRAGQISDEEFKNAKDSLTNRYNEISDSSDAMIAWYMQRSVLGFVDSPDIASLAVSFLTKEHVIEAAKEISLDTVYLLSGKTDGKEESNG